MIAGSADFSLSGSTTFRSVRLNLLFFSSSKELGTVQGKSCTIRNYIVRN